jgi:hypothetical protein
MRPSTARISIRAAALCAAAIVVASASSASAYGPPVYVGTFACNCSGNFSSMRGITVGPDGYVYQVDGTKLHKFDANGNRISTDVLPMTLRDIATGPGFLVAVELTKVWKITIPGMVYSSWGSAGTGSSQFQQANGVACDAAGNIYVVDGVNNRLTKFNSSGTYIAHFTNYAGGSLAAPRGVAVAANGDIWISQTGAVDILRFNSAFAHVQSVTPATTNPVISLAVDLDQNIIAAAAAIDHVSFEPPYKYYRDYPGLWDGIPPAAGGDVAIASDGSLYVEDQSTLRIHRYRRCVPPTITMDLPASPVTLSLGSSVSLTIASTGDAPFGNQWYRDGNFLTDGPDYSGQFTPSLTIQGTSTAVEGLYSVTHWNACDVANPQPTPCYVRVCTQPQITQEPFPASTTPGQTVYFTAAAIGANTGPYPIPLQYQWFKNGFAIFDNGHYAGTQSNELSVNNVTAADTGQYFLQVSNLCGFDTSDTVGILVGNCFNMVETQTVPIDTGLVNPEDGPSAIVAKDLDQDGWIDLVVAGQRRQALYQFRNLGAGHMAPWVKRATPDFSPRFLAIADVNEDSEPDFLALGPSPFPNDFSRLLVMKSPTYTNTDALYYHNSLESPTGLAAGDFNTDGHTDIAMLHEHLSDVTGTGLYPVMARYGNGSGFFPPAAGIHGPAAPDTFDYHGLVTGNMDGDEVEDDLAYLANSDWFGSPATVVHGLGQGGGFPDRWLGWTTPIQPGTSMIAADFNGDGLDDVAMATLDNGVKVFINPGSGNTTQPRTLPMQGATQVLCMAAGDFNGDQRTDLAAMEYGSYILRMFWGLGNGTFARNNYAFNLWFNTPPAPFAIPQAMVAADLDNNGIDDLIVTGQNFASYEESHQLHIIRNPCGVTAVEPSAPAPGARPLAAAPSVFRDRTTLSFSLAAPGVADLAIFDVSGRRVRELASGPLAVGEHRVEWDGRGEGGAEAGSGIYFARLRAGGTDRVARLLRMR